MVLKKTRTKQTCKHDHEVKLKTTEPSVTKHIKPKYQCSLDMNMIQVNWAGEAAFIVSGRSWIGEAALLASGVVWVGESLAGAGLG